MIDEEGWYVLEMRKVHGGQLVGSRVIRCRFDGIGKDVPGKLTCAEEYQAAMKAKELYRDAAHAAGKWPTMEERLRIKEEYDACFTSSASQETST